MTPRIRYPPPQYHFALVLRVARQKGRFDYPADYPNAFFRLVSFSETVAATTSTPRPVVCPLNPRKRTKTRPPTLMRRVVPRRVCREWEWQRRCAAYSSSKSRAMATTNNRLSPKDKTAMAPDHSVAG